MSRLTWSLLGIGGCAIALACINDSDTLAVEARGLPEVVDVIAGRFERNPDLYYEMRLARVTKELESQPAKLENYDDAAACCDRLGRSGEAIEWMDKKWAEMERMELPSDSPHPYRYYANIGTMRAHKWLKGGAKADEIHLLKKAYEEIKQAVTINPDAHFGREWIQLDLMGELLFSTDGSKKMADLRAEHTAFMQTHIPEDPFRAAPQMIEGITGIIVLGAGWDSEKVWGELNKWLWLDEKSRLAELAQHRWKELGGAAEVSNSENRVSRAYKALRENGDAYANHRHEFMLARLEKGEHPDTHPGFWDGYEEVPRLDLAPYSARTNSGPGWFLRNGKFVLGLVGGAAVLGVLVLVAVGRTRRARA